MFMDANLFDYIGQPNDMNALGFAKAREEVAVVVFLCSQAHVMFFAFWTLENRFYHRHGIVWCWCCLWYRVQSKNEIQIKSFFFL